MTNLLLKIEFEVTESHILFPGTILDNMLHMLTKTFITAAMVSYQASSMMLYNVL